MMNRILVGLAAALLATTAAYADEGKVVSVVDGKVVVDMGGPAKYKAGSKVKLNGKVGTVTAVDGDKLTVKAPNAADLAAGGSVKVDKAPALQGC